MKASKKSKKLESSRKCTLLVFSMHQLIANVWAFDYLTRLFASAWT